MDVQGAALSALSDEQRFRLLSDNPRDVVYHCSPDLRLTWVSHAITTVLGWEPSDVVGMSIPELTHPDDAMATSSSREAVAAGTFIPELAAGSGPAVRIRGKDGGYRWMGATGVPVFDDSGPIGVVGRLRDVDAAVRAQHALAVSETQRRIAFDSLLDPLLVMRAVRDTAGSVVDFEYEQANPAACDYNGMTHDEMVGSRLLELNPGNRASGIFDNLVAVLDTGTPLILDNYEYEQELKGGEWRVYDLRVARAGDVLIYTWRDSTQRFETERTIAEREELYRLVTDDVADAVVRWNDDAIVTWASPSFERLTGFPAESVVGRSGMDLLPPEVHDEADELYRRRIAGEDVSGTRLLMKHRDGPARWILARSRPFVHEDGTADGYVAVLRDIHEQVEAEQRREHEVGHDALTGLANRELALARIDRALDDLGGGRRLVALLSIGVDRLSTVNQALSYAAGDHVLTAVAGRIAGAVGDPDRVARVAGDEFVVLISDLHSVSEAASKAERLCAAARGRLTVEGQVLEPTVSIGVAIGDPASSSEDLLRKASLAMKQAKHAGRDRWQFIDPQLALEAQRRLRVESQLRDVLLEGLIVPWYQPVVTLGDRITRGYEALARWITPSGPPIEPPEFLAVAESTGLIVDVDLAVLRHVLDVLRDSRIGHVAVNVSPPSLSNADYVGQFISYVRASGIDATRLRLEVTETALLDVSPAIGAAMRSMSETGATWYVDDFGTGFSSISHLRDLPVRGLKLDQSFTAGIRNGDATCIKLAQGLIGLADGLGLDTVAEGIETEFEAGALLGQGWHQGQGWLFGRPQKDVHPSVR